MGNIKVGCGFPMVISPEFRMGQYSKVFLARRVSTKILSGYNSQPIKKKLKESKLRAQ